MSANDTQVGGEHYKNLDIEPWDVIDTWPVEQRIGFYRGNALKYIMRLGAKDVMTLEAKKAGHYCQKLAEVLTEVGEVSDKGKRATSINAALDEVVWCIHARREYFCSDNAMGELVKTVEGLKQ